MIVKMRQMIIPEKNKKKKSKKIAKKEERKVQSRKEKKLYSLKKIFPLQMAKLILQENKINRSMKITIIKRKINITMICK